MKDYNEIIKEILSLANEDPKVKIVLMNGSRINKNAKPDMMQDYDVVFLMEDVELESYKTNRHWIDGFGDLVMYQQNDFEDGSYIFLMQFKDGNRIDLRFAHVNLVQDIINEDTLVKVLLDKDNVLDKLPEPTDEIHWVRKPSEKRWNSLLNNCWWIQTYVAKGIWRDEFSYVEYMYHSVLMDGIEELNSYYVGSKHKWQVNVGKCGKWFKKLMPADVYEDYLNLFPSNDYKDIWKKLYLAGDYIRKIGGLIADELGYKYPVKDDMEVTQYITRIMYLPKKATTMDVKKAIIFDFDRTLVTCSDSAVKVYDGAVSLLDKLKKKGYKLGLITNGLAKSQHLKIDESGLRKFFDLVLVSGEVGIHKPDAEIFEMALNELGIEAYQAYFVGDHPINDIYGAYHAGLEPIWMEGSHNWDDSLDVARCNRIKNLADLEALLYLQD